MTYLATEEYQKQVKLSNSLDEERLTPDDVDCECEEHPEGAKRGGYVPVHYSKGARVFWDEGGQCWVPYDDEE